MGVPVATPISASDCLAAAAAVLNRDDHREEFERDVRELLSGIHVRSLNSGRAALLVVLQAMKKPEGRDEVVLPAYACPSIGRAVVKAGLKPILCDVGPTGSGLDLQSLVNALNRRTLAVVAAHLYGYPCDIAPILERTHDAGAMLIEDAAQAFGARWNSRYVGTFGDAGIFSFGMSKVLWSIAGGLAVTSSPVLATRIDQEASALPDVGKCSEAVGIGKLAVLGFLVRRHHLRPLDAVWGGMLRGKHDCDDFDACLGSSSQAAVAKRLLRRFSAITRIRRQNAQYLATHLADFGDIILPEVPAGSEPVFLRFPVIAGSGQLKRELVSHLRSQGINASEMYSKQSYEALRSFATRQSPCPQAEYLSDRMLNLPTHSFIKESDRDLIVKSFRSVLVRRRTRSVASTTRSTVRA
jgi:dTDP-4-amino-4,6-dideoxygalactose transaminase